MRTHLLEFTPWSLDLGVSGMDFDSDIRRNVEFKVLVDLEHGRLFVYLKNSRVGV